MSYKVINCEQGSEEWHAARAGVITASMFHGGTRRRGTLAGCIVSTGFCLSRRNIHAFPGCGLFRIESRMLLVVVAGL